MTGTTNERLTQVRSEEQRRYEAINQAIAEYVGFANSVPNLSGKPREYTDNCWVIRKYLNKMRDRANKEIKERLGVEDLL